MSLDKSSAGLCANVRADLSKLNAGGTGFLTMIACLFLRPGFLAAFLYRVGAASYQRGLPGRMLAKLFWRLNVLWCACDISPRAVIGPGLHLPHPMGVVIGEATIGSNVKILQNVALGMKDFNATDHDPVNYPTIGDGAILCAGAVIAGGILVGAGAIIGANAVVTTDIPAGSTAVGVPARIIAKI